MILVGQKVLLTIQKGIVCELYRHVFGELIFVSTRDPTRSTDFRFNVLRMLSDSMLSQTHSVDERFLTLVAPEGND